MIDLKDPEYLYLVKQGSDEWHHKRMGIVTASQINALITAKGKPAKNQAMRSYACQIASQREYSFLEDNYQSFDMMRGHYCEQIARDIYNDSFDEVFECGIITRQINGFVLGASPDGLVGKDGGIEIKSRVPKFQFETINAGEVPDEYMNQVQACLLVSGRDWWDYVQYSNGLPLFVRRVKPDEERQALIVNALDEFEVEVQRVHAEFKEKSAGLVQTKRIEIKFEDDVIVAS